MFYGALVSQGMNLQANLSAMTAMGEPCFPHHPITCANGPLMFHEDGVLECDHGRAVSGDLRTQSALDASVAIMLFELVHERFGSTPRNS